AAEPDIGAVPPTTASEQIARRTRLAPRRGLEAVVPPTAGRHRIVRPPDAPGEVDEAARKPAAIVQRIAKPFVLALRRGIERSGAEQRRSVALGREGAGDDRVREGVERAAQPVAGRLETPGL